MPFDATVYRILIASPGDLSEERKAIPEIIAEWNHINAFAKKVVLLPLKWETHAAPLLGDRPQAIVNSQVVSCCDMLIGVFWTRLGTPTGVSDSGTVEEIEAFLQAKKPVMLYFSGAQVDPNKIDLKQFAALRDFRTQMQTRGLVGSYENQQDFREKLFRQLSQNVDALLSASTPTSSSATPARVSDINSDTPPSRITIEPYSEKAILVKGNTRPIKDELKALGGSWNVKLGGWIFSKKKESQVAQLVATVGR